MSAAGALYWVTFLAFLSGHQGTCLKVSAGPGYVNITSSGIPVARVALPPNNWHLIFLDGQGNTLLPEATDQKKGLGFGRWEGEYIDAYEGYLLRVGGVVEWHEATQVVSWSHDNIGEGVHFVVGTTDTKGRVLFVNFTSHFMYGMTVQISISGEDAAEINRLSIGFEIPDDEGFFGFGERFTDCNQRGHRVGSWLEDGSWGLGVLDPAKWKLRVPKGEESTYAPMPLLISTRSYGIQLHSFYRTVFDLAKTTESVLMLEVEDRSFEFSFFSERNPRDVFSTMMDRIGGTSLIPPPWQFGPWNQLGSEVKGKSNLQQLEDLLFKYDVPVSHDVNTVHFFPEGAERGNEDVIKAENEKILSLGVKSTCYFNPMLSSSYKELYNVAARNGYFTKTVGGAPYNFSYVAAQDFHVSQLDFSNEAAVKWYQDQLQRAVDLKFHGWMYDYGEYTPHDSVSINGTSGLEMHNHYPLLYQKAAFDFFRSLDPDPDDDLAPDYVFYVRSGYVGTQKYTWAHWTGDPSSDWSYASGLPAQIAASLNIGLSGVPYSGSDIGGFEWYVQPPPDLELWARWTAAGAVSGIMHEQGGGKGNGDKTHIFDSPEGLRIWRKFAKFRTQLFPYLYLQAVLSRSDLQGANLPLMQHHLLNFWYDKVAISQCYQFMFGSSLLAAPVVEQGVKEWEVYVPGRENDLWLDFSSYAQYDESDGRFRIGFGGYIGAGSTVKVVAPLDSVPLFVPAGSVIQVLDPSVQTLSNASNSSVTSYYDRQNIFHAWMFPDLNFATKEKNFLSECMYRMYKVNDSAVDLTVGAPNGNSTSIIQIAAPWETQGVPSKVTDQFGYVFHLLSSWKDLVVIDKFLDSVYFYDKEQQVLWIRVVGVVNDFTVSMTKNSTKPI